MFSLSRYYGNENIDDLEAKQLIEKVKTCSKEECREIYKQIMSNENLPSFDELIEEIREEIEQFDAYEYAKQNALPLWMEEMIERKQYEWKYLILGDSGKRVTKYDDEYGMFSKIYKILIRENRNLNRIYDLQKTSTERKNVVESEMSYAELKPYLKRKELSFETHCTMGPLFETYYFELNDITKKWLLKYKSVFDFNGEYREYLQDLALYKNEKLMFSSCTHEEFHSDMNI